MNGKKILIKIFRPLLLFFFILFQWSLLLIVLYRFVPVPVTPLHLIRVYEQAVSSRPLRMEKDWEALSGMSKKMPLAVVAAEDPEFFTHHGFDFKQIQNSVERNLEKGKKLRGASTISQQTAKNLLLWPHRSWLRKAFEVYVTVAIEMFWTKRRILEVYLNIIETGEGIYGMEAASFNYFKKQVSELSGPEAALIAATLPNPRRWNAGKPNAYIKRKQAKILLYMRYVKFPEDFFTD